MATILDIIPYKVLPAQMGGQKGIAIFVKHLAEVNEVTAVSVKANEEKLAENYNLIKIFTDARRRYANPFYLFQIKKIVQQRKINNVITEHPYMSWIGFMLKKLLHIKWFVHSHNIEFERFRTLNKSWYKLLRVYETWAYKNADYVFFKTEEDAKFAVDNNMINKERALLIPYGIELKQLPIDIEEQKRKVYAKHNIPFNCKLIFFNGAFDYKPNIDALKFILDEINPLLLKENNFNYRIIICGKNLPSSFNNLINYTDKNVLYLGFVDDVNAYFKAADVFLNPIISGGGVKTKIIDAMGFGATVVSCTTGAAGVKIEACKEKIVVVPDNNAVIFTEAIVKAFAKIIPTPQSYYDFYYWGNIIKRVQPYFR